MLRTVIALLAVTAMFTGRLSFGADNPLHPCEAETAKLMDIKSTWGEIYKAAIALPPACFDGYFAEGISDTLVRKMGQDWSGFLSLIEAHPKEAKFMHLVLESINSTLDPKDIRAVDRLAKSSCRAALRNSCRAISNRAAAALADYVPPEPRNGT